MGVAASEKRVVGLVVAYLDGRVSLDRLQDELSDITWDSPNAPRVAHRVEHLIAEIRSDADLRSALDETVRGCYTHA